MPPAGTSRVKKGRRSFSDIALIALFIFGLSVFLYPPLANFYNHQRQKAAVVSYEKAVSKLDTTQVERLLDEAEAYNDALVYEPGRLPVSQMDQYLRMLNFTGTSVMGTIQIPSLGVNLPIYHTTDEAVLQAGVGHIPGTSLPVGGAGTRAVLTGHRGLPSSKLFTDLDKLKLGDIFVIRVGNRELAYRVSDIVEVLPTQVGALQLEDNRDLVTLVTCTPYGINTHRLLVTGERTELSAVGSIAADAVRVDPVLVAAFVAVPIFVVGLVVVLRRTRSVYAPRHMGKDNNHADEK